MERVMKFLATGLLIALVSTPMLSWATGERTPGTVAVTGNPGTYILGMYNVRYNTSVTKGRIEISLNPGSAFSVSGVDSSTGVSFVCFYARSTNSAQFDQWEKAILSVTHGSWISASRVSTTNSNCNTLQMASGSRFLE
jgi:hypothetical protein